MSSKVKVIRGPIQTAVVNPLSVSADGREECRVDVDAGIGYVHLSAFTKHTVSQLHKVLAMPGDNRMNGLVLDLRDCGNGILTTAPEVVHTVHWTTGHQHRKPCYQQ
ncbi:MAG: hypothetical protein GY758_01235 [Fuerstiella sp.]|jgi:C-terminal processing protease CtpA/Prc|nr:hypothetical protein [Fuerstiella sp.]